MNRGSQLLIAAIASAFLLVGCGDDKQVVSYKKGEYQGKRDSNPWDSAPNQWSRSSWEKGNKPSWENALRQRNAAQNEYARTE